MRTKPRHRPSGTIIATCFSLLCLLVSASHASSYVVVVSKATEADCDWRPVVEALKDKHEACVITYAAHPNEAIGPLADVFPRYTCFVAKPEEANRDFVSDAHQLTRKLDGDPYTDTIWGIITGYDAADALRIARLKDPLNATRLLTGTVGSPMDQYDEGIMFNELRACKEITYAMRTFIEGG